MKSPRRFVLIFLLFTGFFSCHRAKNKAQEVKKQLAGYADTLGQRTLRKIFPPAPAEPLPHVKGYQEVEKWHFDYFPERKLLVDQTPDSILKQVDERFYTDDELLGYKRVPLIFPLSLLVMDGQPYLYDNAWYYSQRKSFPVYNVHPFDYPVSRFQVGNQFLFVEFFNPEWEGVMGNDPPYHYVVLDLKKWESFNYGTDEKQAKKEAGADGYKTGENYYEPLPFDTLLQTPR